MYQECSHNSYTSADPKGLRGFPITTYPPLFFGVQYILVILLQNGIICFM